jgi:hypothetical protein
VSTVLGGDQQSLVKVFTSPTNLVRVNLAGYRPITELYSALVYEFDGAGVPIDAGTYFDVSDIPFPCRIDRWTILADQATDADVDIQLGNFEDWPAVLVSLPIAPLHIANDIKARGDATDWVATLNPGDIVRGIVLNNTQARKLTLTLRVVRLSR